MATKKPADKSDASKTTQVAKEIVATKPATTAPDSKDVTAKSSAGKPGEVKAQDGKTPSDGKRQDAKSSSAALANDSKTNQNAGLAKPKSDKPSDGKTDAGPKTDDKTSKKPDASKEAQKAKAPSSVKADAKGKSSETAKAADKTKAPGTAKSGEKQLSRQEKKTAKAKAKAEKAKGKKVDKDKPVTRPLPETTPQARAKAIARRERAEKSERRRLAKDMQKQAAELIKRSKELSKASVKEEKHREYLESVGDEFDLGADRPVTPIPDLPTGSQQLTLVEVRPERAFIRLSFNSITNTHLYEVIEPPLEEQETHIRDFIADTLVRILDGRHTIDKSLWEDYLEERTDEVIVDHSIILDDISRARIKYHISRDFLGFGPIDVLMRDPLIEDISCDGPEIPIYVFHRKLESIRSNVVFPNDTVLDSFVIRLAQRSGKHISVADPILDATLPDGSRLQTTLSREVTTRGSSFTVRKFREDPITPPALIRFGTMSAQMAAYFWILMESGSSLIYAGGTASGKTTSLNAVCQFIPPTKKVVSIEDTREINLLHENWIAGLTRSGFGSESAGGGRAGAVDMYKLLEAALRQRPEYMIVGEVRGKEALTLFQAMATGHAVYSTMHADSVPSAVHRLENPPINVPRIMLPIMDAMAIQAQTRVKGDLVRRVKEVTELSDIDPGTDDVLTNGVFSWNGATDQHEYLGSSLVLDRFAETRGLTQLEVEAEWKRRQDILQWMADKEMTEIRDVAEVIHQYYRKPEEVLSKLGS